MAEYEDEELKNLVIDIGTGYVKCGFSGDDMPRSVFRSFIGRPKAGSVGLISGSSSDSNKVFVGEEAAANAGVLDLTYVCENGIVKSREALVYVMDQALRTELRVSPEEYNLLLTEAPSNPDRNREMMVEVAFGEFGCKGVQVQIQAVLSLYAAGRTIGIVFDSGDGVSHTVPVYKGYGIKHAVGSTKLAGREVSKHALETLNKYNGIDLRNESNGVDMARQLKEDVCRVALDYEKELEEITNDESLAVPYELKDGTVIQARELQIVPPEILFNPELFLLQRPSIGQILEFTLANVNMQTVKELMMNTVLSGGTTCLKGYQERFTKEYREVASKNRANVNLKVSSPPDKLTSVFTGASLLSSLATFQAKWITKDEWDAQGAAVLNRKRLF